ncbi:MAG: sulfatase-like hydrolase/transferase, partial [Planctomycetaceae bacterium]
MLFDHDRLAAGRISWERWMNGEVMRYCRLACSLALIVSCVAAFPRDLQAAPPNVVVVLADDLGYGDVKSFGLDRCQIDTPHFDRLAREGMRFTSAYAIASVCVPSRMSIMTGRYAFRFGRPAPGGPWGFLGTRLKTNRFTLAKMFRSRGYRTGYVGKWHLGTLMTTTDGKIQGLKNVDYTRPLKIGAPQFGFHESFILPGSLDMYPYVFARNNRWVGKVTATKGWSAFGRMGPAAEDFEDVKVLATFGDEAERFIAASRDRPFFLFVALTAPHTPTSPTKKFEGRSRIGLYGDFVMNTDHTLGRV